MELFHLIWIGIGVLDFCSQREARLWIFYSIAVHEIGHCLGLNARSVAEFRDLIVEDRFVGENAVGGP